MRGLLETWGWQTWPLYLCLNANGLDGAMPCSSDSGGGSATDGPNHAGPSRADILVSCQPWDVCFPQSYVRWHRYILQHSSRIVKQ